MNVKDFVKPEYNGLPGTVSYSTLTNQLGNPLVTVSTADYSGDTYILMANTKGDFGVLTFGWGSCSGCDALEAAYHDWDALQRVADDVERSVRWYGSRAEVLDYLQSENRKFEHSWGSAEYQDFIAKAIEYLEPKPDEMTALREVVKDARALLDIFPMGDSGPDDIANAFVEIDACVEDLSSSVNNYDKRFPK